MAEARIKAYVPPKKNRDRRRARTFTILAIILILAVIAAAGYLLLRPSAPDRSGEGKAAVERLLAAEVYELSGTVATNDGSQHPFNADVRTGDDDTLGSWSGADGTRVQFVRSHGTLFAEVNGAVWGAWGLVNRFEGWAILPDSILGKTPIVVDATTLRSVVSVAPSSIEGSEFTYPDGTRLRLRDDNVSGIRYKGTDFQVTLPRDDSLPKRITDTAKEATSAKVATVNATTDGFSVTIPPGAAPREAPAPPRPGDPRATPHPGETPSATPSTSSSPSATTSAPAPR